MPIAVAMPRLGMQMREGTLVLWHAQPGERVEKGRPLLVIESDKAEVDVESPASGFLRQVYVAPGATVPCGSLLGALTETPDEPFDADAFLAERSPARAAGSPAPAPSAPGAASRFASAPGRDGAGPVTPAARRRARELGLAPDALGALVGSGPGGRVLREDVEALAERLASGVEVAPGVRLEVIDSGQGPPLLLLPGFGSDASSFSRIAPALGERFRTRVVHPRGTGASAAPPGSRHTVAEAAADVAVVAGEGGAHVLGVSLGAAVALELALRSPARVRSLVLVTPLVAPRPRLVSVLEAWARVVTEAPPEVAASVLLPWLFSERTLAQPVERARAWRGLVETIGRAGAAARAALVATARAVAEWSPPASEAPSDALVGLRVPTLVIEAGEDLLTGPAEDLARRIAGATHVRIEGAGHALLLEAPEAALAAIGAHLAAHRAAHGDAHRGSDEGRGEVSADPATGISGRYGSTNAGGM